MNDTYISSYKSSRDFIRPSDRVHYHQKQWPDVRAEILHRVNPNDAGGISDFYDEVNRACVKWACITAKTQREFSGGYRDKTIIDVYESITEFSPLYPSINGSKPPSRAGEHIEGFSSKSHARLMKKFKRMRKAELPLPFFVTLTYQNKMMDFERAKKQLNAFLQRFRRFDSAKWKVRNERTGRMNTVYKNWSGWDGFKYAWKMEPQKRGAIHFHLMMFLDPRSFPEGWGDREKFVDGKGYSSSMQCEYLKILIGSVWNKISGQAENFEAVRAKSGRYFGNMALLAGTNVRECHNWDMATGYLSKYMEKSVDGTPWKDEKTGRFWGFSNNFDYSVYYNEVYDMAEIEKTRKKLYALSVEAWKAYEKREESNLQRLEFQGGISKKEKKKRIITIRKRMIKQRRRFLINQMKIEQGARVQIEITQDVARRTLE